MSAKEGRGKARELGGARDQGARGCRRWRGWEGMWRGISTTVTRLKNSRKGKKMTAHAESAK